MKKCIVVFSGGIDSVCMCTYLKNKYKLYGITFAYGQRASKEIKASKFFSGLLDLAEHKIIDMTFMKNIYGKTNPLTNYNKKIPEKFDYTIVVPIRNAVFLSIATAWAFTLGAVLVSYGAHKGDNKYPDCRPEFSAKIEDAFNQAEIDGIKSGIRKKINIWSPFINKLTKSELLINGYKELGDIIFKAWSCYNNNKFHCGKCESCNNRKYAFTRANIVDKTKYIG